MRIRNKLLVLLLAIALVPLLAASVLDRLAAHRLGRRLAGETRQILAEQAERRLRRIVLDFGRVLHRDQLLLELAVRLQAEAIERRLAGPVPTGGEVFLAVEIDANTHVPPGLAPSERHVRLDAAGRPRPLRVSYEAQAYVLAPGVELSAAAGDIARLATMSEVYRAVFARIAHLAHWQYAALESGVHTTYPAHGGYPRDYDPRQRPWYRQAVAAGRLTWLPPLLDITTGKVMHTVCMPIRRDGRIVGAAAIDVPAERIFRDLALPAEWAEASAALLAHPTAGGAGQSGCLAVLSAKQYAGPAAGPTTSPAIRMLGPEDCPVVATLRADALAGRTAVRRLPYRGRPALWAHGGCEGGNAFPIVIVPEDVVFARAAAAEDYVLAEIVEGLQLTGLILLVVVVAVVVLAFRSSRVVTRPVAELAEAAEALGRGDYGARVAIRTGDELQALAERFNDIGPKLAERERLKRSMHLAMEIQQHLLPPGPPVLAGFDIAGRSLYCDETGGDYYDFLELMELGPGRLGVAVGDVTGHGIAAALLMASARALLRSHAARHGEELGLLFNELNRHLVRDTGDERFVTLFYGLLDAERRALWWTSGGHDPPLWLRRATGRIEELPSTGIPLGILEEASYGQGGPVTLERGDVMVIGTDGIWEARNPAGEMFGKERLREILAAAAPGAAEETYAAIVEAVRQFRGTQPQEDDITLVVIKAL